MQVLQTTIAETRASGAGVGRRDEPEGDDGLLSGDESHRGEHRRTTALVVGQSLL